MYYEYILKIIILLRTFSHWELDVTWVMSPLHSASLEVSFSFKALFLKVNKRYMKILKRCTKLKSAFTISQVSGYSDLEWWHDLYSCPLNNLTCLCFAVYCILIMSLLKSVSLLFCKIKVLRYYFSDVSLTDTKHLYKILTYIPNWVMNVLRKELVHNMRPGRIKTIFN